MTDTQPEVTRVGDAIAGKLYEESEVYWALERGQNIPGVVLDRIAQAAIAEMDTTTLQVRLDEAEAEVERLRERLGYIRRLATGDKLIEQTIDTLLQKGQP